MLHSTESSEKAFHWPRDHERWTSWVHATRVHKGSRWPPNDLIISYAIESRLDI